MLAETVVTVLGGLAALQTGIGTLYYWRKRDSDRATIRKLRDRGLTIGQLAQAFHVNRNTIVKILRESHDTSNIKDDAKSDWSERLDAWCKTNNKHLNTFNCQCSKCQAKEKMYIYNRDW
jgi:hypothetical protein